MSTFFTKSDAELYEWYRTNTNHSFGKNADLETFRRVLADIRYEEVIKEASLYYGPLYLPTTKDETPMTISNTSTTPVTLSAPNTPAGHTITNHRRNADVARSMLNPAQVQNEADKQEVLRLRANRNLSSTDTKASDAIFNELWSYIINSIHTYSSKVRAVSQAPACIQTLDTYASAKLKFALMLGEPLCDPKLKDLAISQVVSWVSSAIETRPSGSILVDLVDVYVGESTPFGTWLNFIVVPTANTARRYTAHRDYLTTSTYIRIELFVIGRDVVDNYAFLNGQLKLKDSSYLARDSLFLTMTMGPSKMFSLLNGLLRPKELGLDEFGIYTEFQAEKKYFGHISVSQLDDIISSASSYATSSSSLVRFIHSESQFFDRVRNNPLFTRENFGLDEKFNVVPDEVPKNIDLTYLEKFSSYLRSMASNPRPYLSTSQIPPTSTDIRKLNSNVDSMFATLINWRTNKKTSYVNKMAPVSRLKQALRITEDTKESEALVEKCIAFFKTTYPNYQIEILKRNPIGLRSMLVEHGINPLPAAKKQVASESVAAQVTAPAVAAEPPLIVR